MPYSVKDEYIKMLNADNEKLADDNLKLEQKVEILAETSYPDMNIKAFDKCFERFIKEHPLLFVFWISRTIFFCFVFSLLFTYVSSFILAFIN